MESKNYFSGHSSKLKLEAWLRSLLCGGTVGFAGAFSAAFVTWLTAINGVWLPLTVLAAVTIIATPLFYLMRFHPTNVSSARRIDGLGLEERLVTMVEYSSDESFIAKRQREDAFNALSKTNANQIKITFSKNILVALAICAFLGSAMTTVSVLGEHGMLPGGDELVDSFIDEALTEYVTVTYIIEDGGILEGDEAQIIVKGTDATEVIAVADDGYVFAGWNDGSVDPSRLDKGIIEDIVYIALFMPLDGEGEQGEESDEPPPEDPNDAPSNSEQEQNNNNNQQNQNQQSQNSTAGGKYDANNQIIDGNKYYREQLDERYREEALALLDDENSGLTDEERELLKKYFGIL